MPQNSFYNSCWNNPKFNNTTSQQNNTVTSFEFHSFTYVNHSYFSDFSLILYSLTFHQTLYNSNFSKFFCPNKSRLKTFGPAPKSWGPKAKTKKKHRQGDERVSPFIIFLLFSSSNCKTCVVCLWEGFSASSAHGQLAEVFTCKSIDFFGQF